MDDFNTSSLYESRNEWCSRLVNILTPHIIEGLQSIFSEAEKICRENNESEKYLMTFQNFVSRIPKWNPNIIEIERKRIAEKSNCVYLEDLITCVHIIQLKLLTAMRAGTKQKKININIPKIDDFIHKIYIHLSRKVYKKTYLFQKNIPPLEIQRNFNDLENTVKESILNAIRDSIPVETILRAYMDETTEEEVIEEIKEQIIENPKKTTESKPQPEKLETANISNEPKKLEGYLGTPGSPGETGTQVAPTGSLKFQDVDYVKNIDGSETTIHSPKDIISLEMRNANRKNDEDEDDDNIKIKITDENLKIDDFEFEDIGDKDIPDLLIDDIEVLV